MSSSTRITTYHSLQIQLVQNPPDDEGPMRSETCRAKLKCWLKLIHCDHTVYFVGLHIYYKMIHGLYNIKCGVSFSSVHPWMYQFTKFRFYFTISVLRFVNNFHSVRTIKRLVPTFVPVRCTDICCASRADSCRHFQYVINFVQLFFTEYVFLRVLHYRLKQNQSLESFPPT